MVSTVAGTGQAGYLDGDGSTAMFNIPTGLAFIASDRSLLVADYKNHRIRLIKRGGEHTIVETLAGSGEEGDEEGGALECKFSHPHSLCIDHSKNLCYILAERKIRTLSLR